MLGIDGIESCKHKIILCLESALIYLGLIEYNKEYSSKIRVYSESPLLCGGNLEVIYLPDCFKLKRHLEKDGMYCTTEEQTLEDMMDNITGSNKNILVEALSSYYKNNDKSFKGLEGNLSGYQFTVFSILKDEVIRGCIA